MWDVWTAQRTLASFVSVEDNDKGDEVIVVKDVKGATILGKDGNPAPFAEAIGELIGQLPNKDRILRGSGKTGSGSSGGVTGGSSSGFIDASTLTPEQARDPNVIKRLQAQVRRGGQISGRAYN